MMRPFTVPGGDPTRNHLAAAGGDSGGFDWDRLLQGGPSTPSSKTPFAGRTWSHDSIRRASQRGTGTAIGHAGEILQGWFRTPTGLVVPGLVTLSDPTTRSRVTFVPTVATSVTVHEPWRTKARAAAERTLAFLGLPPGGKLLVDSGTRPGAGRGSSTSDVVASVRAVADAYAFNLGAARLGALAVRSETASDATMFGNRPVLFAQRHGFVVEDFAVWTLPPLVAVHFDDGEGVDTLAYAPAQYTPAQVDFFHDLRGELRTALRRGDARGVGRVATESAVVNQAFLPKPHFDEIRELATSAGALGISVAHSGSGVALLFDALDSDLGRRLALAEVLLEELGFSERRVFATSPFEAAA